jgi:hypothetical protein
MILPFRLVLFPKRQATTRSRDIPPPDGADSLPRSPARPGQPGRYRDDPGDDRGRRGGLPGQAALAPAAACRAAPRTTRRLGYLPQNVGYYPGFTVAESVEYFALLKEVPAAQIPAAVATAIERVELGGAAWMGSRDRRRRTTDLMTTTAQAGWVRLLVTWAGPTAYLVIGAYGLYTQWHRPALTTPWIWPARPPHDLGAAICAALVFSIGIVVTSVRGARDPAGE